MYIYLIQTSESIRCGDSIYKIGKTDSKDPNTRTISYPKGSSLLFCILINNVQAEEDLLSIFNKKYKHCPQHGKEYFEGSPADMISTIHSYYVLNNLSDKPKLTKNIESKNITEQHIPVVIKQYIDTIIGKTSVQTGPNIDSQVEKNITIESNNPTESSTSENELDETTSGKSISLDETNSGKSISLEVNIFEHFQNLEQTKLLPFEKVAINSLDEFTQECSDRNLVFCKNAFWFNKWTYFEPKNIPSILDIFFTISNKNPIIKSLVERPKFNRGIVCHFKGIYLYIDITRKTVSLHLATDPVKYTKIIPWEFSPHHYKEFIQTIEKWSADHQVVQSKLYDLLTKQETIFIDEDNNYNFGLYFSEMLEYFDLPPIRIMKNMRSIKKNRIILLKGIRNYSDMIKEYAQENYLYFLLWILDIKPISKKNIFNNLVSLSTNSVEIKPELSIIKVLDYYLIYDINYKLLPKKLAGDYLKSLNINLENIESFLISLDVVQFETYLQDFIFF